MDKTNKNASKTNRKQKKVETPITIENYQKLAMRTCLPACKCWGYACTQFLSELSEFFAKHWGLYAKTIRGDLNKTEDDHELYLQRVKEIRKEVGDIAWSLALFCELTNTKFHKCLKKAKNDRATKLRSGNEISVSDFAFIDDQPYSKEWVLDKEWQIPILEKAFMYFLEICSYYQFKVSDVLRDNIRKLASRQKRGVIMGNGDNR
jgi:hypothetical protein